MRKKYSKLKKLRVVMALRRMDRNHDRLLFRISLTIFSLIVAFIVLGSILQMNWFDGHFPVVPLLVWISQQQVVGVFFIPFIVLLMAVCQFIMLCSKPITIDTVASNVTVLQSYDDITREAYNKFTELCASEKKLLIERRKQQYNDELEVLAQRKKINEIKASEKK